MWCNNLSEPQNANPSVSKFDCRWFRGTALLVTSSNDIFRTLGIQRLVMLTNDSACISTDRICGATFYQSLRAQTPVSQCLTVCCVGARALLVTSSNNIFKTLVIQRLAMLTDNSANISTIGYVVLQFIRASESWPQCLNVWLYVV